MPPASGGEASAKSKVSPLCRQRPQEPLSLSPEPGPALGAMRPRPDGAPSANSPPMGSTALAARLGGRDLHHVARERSETPRHLVDSAQWQVFWDLLWGSVHIQGVMRIPSKMQKPSAPQPPTSPQTWKKPPSSRLGKDCPVTGVEVTKTILVVAWAEYLSPNVALNVAVKIPEDQDCWISTGRTKWWRSRWMRSTPPQKHQEYTFRHRSACRTPAESRQAYLTSGKEYIEPCKPWDQIVSLWSGRTDYKTLDYQRTNPGECHIVRTYIKETTVIQDPASLNHQ